MIQSMNENRIYRRMLSPVIVVLCVMTGLTSCQDTEKIYMSLNKLELTIHPKESFQYEVWMQTEGETSILSSEEVDWDLIDQKPINTESSKVVAIIDENGKLTAIAPGQALVQAVSKRGEKVLGSLLVNAWETPNPKGLVLSKNEVYMPVTQTLEDSLTLTVDDAILQKFDLVVTSSNTDAIDPKLVAPTEADLAAGNKDYKIALKRGESIEDEDVEIKVSAGETAVSCIVHLGMRLYLAFSDIDLTDGVNPNLVTTTTLSIGLNEEKTVEVNYKLVPDDNVHLEKMKENVHVTVQGDPVVTVADWEFTNDNIKVFLKTGVITGNANVIVEGLGVQATTECNVLDYDKIEVESVTFDMEGIHEMVGNVQLETSEAGYGLFDYVSVKPITAAVYWPLEWKSSNPEIAEVNGEGFVSIKKAGIFTITATCKDVNTSVTFTAKLKLEKISIPNSVLTDLAVGEETQWPVALTAKSNYITEDVVLEWKSSDESVVKVNENGKLTAVGAGEATISVVAVDDYGTQVEAEKKVIVKSLDDIAIENLNFSTNTHLYLADIASESGMGGSLLTIMNMETEEVYEISLFTKTGEVLIWDTDTVYTAGEHFNIHSYVYYPSGEKAVITQGNIKVTADGTLFFDLIAGKSSKVVTVKGTVSLSE